MVHEMENNFDETINKSIELINQAMNETTDPEKLDKLKSLLEYVGILTGKDMKR